MQTFCMEITSELTWPQIKLLRHKLEAAQDALTIAADQAHEAGDYWAVRAFEATYDEIGDVIA